MKCTSPSGLGPQAAPGWLAEVHSAQPRSLRLPATPGTRFCPRIPIYTHAKLLLNFGARQLAIPCPTGRTWSYGGEEGVPPAAHHQVQLVPKTEFNLATSNSLDANKTLGWHPLQILSCRSQLHRSGTDGTGTTPAPTSSERKFDISTWRRTAGRSLKKLPKVEIFGGTSPAGFTSRRGEFPNLSLGAADTW